MPVPDFLAFESPSMAVPCPDCGARVGASCKRASGHRANMLHKARHEEADRQWLINDLPTITRRPDGTFIYDGPETRPSVTHPEEREKMMSKIGPKEQQKRALRERAMTTTIEPNATVSITPEGPAIKPEPQQQESNVKRKPTPKTAKKKTSTAKARTSVKPKTATTAARPDGLRPGSKQAIMLDMVLREEGATELAICKKLGWKKCRVTLKRVAEKVGAKLESRKNVAGDAVWFATMPKAKAA